VTSYLILRDPLRPLLDEEDPAQDPKVVSQLTEEEKKAREDAKAAKMAEAKAAEKEAAAKEAEEIAGKDELGKIQHASEREQKKLEGEMQGRLKVKRVSKEQKDKIFKAIRYSHLQHAELMSLGKNPRFESEAKDYIMQGLSFKLNPFEGAKPED
jgi:hypothetical protein